MLRRIFRLAAIVSVTLIIVLATYALYRSRQRGLYQRVARTRATMAQLVLWAEISRVPMSARQTQDLMSALRLDDAILPGYARVDRATGRVFDDWGNAICLRPAGAGRPSMVLVSFGSNQVDNAGHLDDIVVPLRLFPPHSLKPDGPHAPSSSSSDTQWQPRPSTKRNAP